jgi:hypothetical protein
VIYDKILGQSRSCATLRFVHEPSRLPLLYAAACAEPPVEAEKEDEEKDPLSGEYVRLAQLAKMVDQHEKKKKTSHYYAEPQVLKKRSTAPLCSVLTGLSILELKSEQKVKKMQQMMTRINNINNNNNNQESKRNSR